MLPFRDDSQRGATPWATLALLAAVTAAFAAQLTSHPWSGGAMVERFAMIPARVLGDPWSSAHTLLSSSFLHAGWGHLLVNALFLWVFGPGAEDRAGRARFLAVWATGSAAAATAHLAAHPDSAAPLVGASGAISAVMGLTCVLRPKAPIRAAVFVTVVPVGVVRVPAAFLLGVWALVQLANGVAPVTAASEGVAWYAHLGGFAAGLAWGVLLRRPTPAGRRSRPARPPRTRPNRARA